MRGAPALMLAAAACGGASETDRLRDAVRTSHDAPPPPAVAFRFPGTQAGDVRAYRLPTLERAAWQFSTGNLVTSRALGYGHEDDRAWALTPTRALVALELETGRARLLDSGVVAATLGPRGAPIIATTDGTVKTWRGRSGNVIADSLDGAIERLFGTVSDRVLAVVRVGGERRLVPLEPGAAPPDGQVIPNGPIAATPWGELIAVASDTGLVLLDGARDDRLGFEPADPADAIAFSAAGHRLYVARGADIEVLDRFDLSLVGRLHLPEAVLDLRPDPWGRVLLARHAHGNAFWIVPLVGDAPAVMVDGTWGPELPVVAPDGTVLARVGDDIVARSCDGTERGRLADAAGDHWAVAAWHPDQAPLALARAGQADAAGAAPGTAAELYVQVSSTSNPTWAEDLAADLRQAGIRASVMPPGTSFEMYRVVVGPFATREAAEATGRTLGMSFWIFQPDPPGGQ